MTDNNQTRRELLQQIGPLSDAAHDAIPRIHAAAAEMLAAFEAVDACKGAHVLDVGPRGYDDCDVTDILRDILKETVEVVQTRVAKTAQFLRDDLTTWDREVA